MSTTCLLLYKVTKNLDTSSWAGATYEKRHKKMKAETHIYIKVQGLIKDGILSANFDCCLLLLD